CAEPAFAADAVATGVLAAAGVGCPGAAVVGSPPCGAWLAGAGVSSRPHPGRTPSPAAPAKATAFAPPPSIALRSGSGTTAFLLSSIIASELLVGSRQAGASSCGIPAPLKRHRPLQRGRCKSRSGHRLALLALDAALDAHRALVVMVIQHLAVQARDAFVRID